jgi:hypothetical protein
MPYVPSGVRKLHHAHHRGAERFFGVSLAHELHEPKATRLSGRFINNKMHSLDAAEF